MNLDEFIQICGDAKFWQWVRNKSLVPYEDVPNRNVFLAELHQKIANRTYYPSPPKEYLTLNKGKGVLRIIPVLSLQDLVIFYYCARKLERHIAINHVPGTYGGFGFSGRLRRVEEEEIAAIDDSLDVEEMDGETYVFQELAGYPIQSSFNPKAWQAEWGDFTDKLYHNSFDFQDNLGHENGGVIELDISNFYDSIQLDNLEYKIRKYISNEENEVVYLLLHFLRFWNRHINFYRQQGAGVPQDLFGECSRILANFYLQNYDSNLSSFCQSINCRYFRYADDQVIFLDDIRHAEKIIGKASSFLMKEGLNFNQKKVNKMTFPEFRRYYTFDNFMALARRPQTAIIEQQIDFYINNRRDLRKHGLSLLKRILNVVSQNETVPANINDLKRVVLDYDFLKISPLYSREWRIIHDLMDENQKRELISIFDRLIENSFYTYFLYNIRQFYIEIGRPIDAIENKIAELKTFYSIN